MYLANILGTVFLLGWLSKILNKTPVKAFTPSAERKMGTRWSFVKKVND